MNRGRAQDPPPIFLKTTPIPPSDGRSDASDRLLEKIAWMMDRAVTIPGTRVSVGLDALLGLFPGVGDVLASVIQAGIVLVAIQRHRVPKAVAARMVANVLIDTGLGSIPFLGDIFDVFFKANTRNIQLLSQVQEHQKKGEPIPAAPSVAFLLLVGALLGAAILLSLVGTIFLITWLIRRPLI